MGTGVLVRIALGAVEKIFLCLYPSYHLNTVTWGVRFTIGIYPNPVVDQRIGNIINFRIEYLGVVKADTT